MRFLSVALKFTHIAAAPEKAGFLFLFFFPAFSPAESQSGIVEQVKA
jgi:hypothetical protein